MSGPTLTRNEIARRQIETAIRMSLKHHKQKADVAIPEPSPQMNDFYIAWTIDRYLVLVRSMTDTMKIFATWFNLIVAESPLLEAFPGDWPQRLKSLAEVARKAPREDQIAFDRAFPRGARRRQRGIGSRLRFSGCARQLERGHHRRSRSRSAFLIAAH
jgi:hypothetical protein